MSIGEHEWSRVEIKAQLAEAGQIHCEKVPPPTQEQQLLWATTELAKSKARIHRLQGGIYEALGWLKLGESDRAQSLLSQVAIDM